VEEVPLRENWIPIEERVVGDLGETTPYGGLPVIVGEGCLVEWVWWVVWVVGGVVGERQVTLFFDCEIQP